MPHSHFFLVIETAVDGQVIGDSLIVDASEPRAEDLAHEEALRLVQSDRLRSDRTVLVEVEER